MAPASGEVRVRLEAELARICDRAEYHMLRQVDRHGQRRLIVRPEVPVRESWQLASFHRLGSECVLHAQAPNVNQVAADGDAAASVPGDQDAHQAGLARLCRGTGTRPPGMAGDGEPGSPALIHPAADELGFGFSAAPRRRP